MENLFDFCFHCVCPFRRMKKTWTERFRRDLERLLLGRDANNGNMDRACLSRILIRRSLKREEERNCAENER